MPRTTFKRSGQVGVYYRPDIKLALEEDFKLIGFQDWVIKLSNSNDVSDRTSIVRKRHPEIIGILAKSRRETGALNASCRRAFAKPRITSMALMAAAATKIGKMRLNLRAPNMIVQKSIVEAANMLHYTTPLLYFKVTHPSCSC